MTLTILLSRELLSTTDTTKVLSIVLKLFIQYRTLERTFFKTSVVCELILMMFLSLNTSCNTKFFTEVYS